MTKLGEKILISYSTIASTALLVTVLAGAASQKIATFDELNVHRIDVVEPDGHCDWSYRMAQNCPE